MSNANVWCVLGENSLKYLTLLFWNLECMCCPVLYYVELWTQRCGGADKSSRMRAIWPVVKTERSSSCMIMNVGQKITDTWTNSPTSHSSCILVRLALVSSNVSRADMKNKIKLKKIIIKINQIKLTYEIYMRQVNHLAS